MHSNNTVDTGSILYLGSECSAAHVRTYNTQASYKTRKHSKHKQLRISDSDAVVPVPTRTAYNTMGTGSVFIPRIQVWCCTCITRMHSIDIFFFISIYLIFRCDTAHADTYSSQALWVLIAFYTSDPNVLPYISTCTTRCQEFYVIWI